MRHTRTHACTHPSGVGEEKQNIIIGSLKIFWLWRVRGYFYRNLSPPLRLPLSLSFSLSPPPAPLWRFEIRVSVSAYFSLRKTSATRRISLSDGERGSVDANATSYCNVISILGKPIIDWKLLTRSPLAFYRLPIFAIYFYYGKIHIVFYVTIVINSNV